MSWSGKMEFWKNPINTPGFAGETEMAGKRRGIDPSQQGFPGKIPKSGFFWEENTHHHPQPHLLWPYLAKHWDPG